MDIELTENLYARYQRDLGKAILGAQVKKEKQNISKR
jgi:hypothetical protein